MKSLKISWFRRLVNNLDNPWIYLFKHSIAPVETVIQLGNLKIQHLARITKNKFWQSALDALHYYTEKISLYVLNIPLWLNSNISKYPLCINSCYNKGITTLGDILDSNHIILSKEELYNRYLVETYFLTYLRIHKAVTKYLSNNNILDLNHLSHDRPNIPYLISKLKLHTNLSFILTKNGIGYQLNSQIYSGAFKICFNTIKNNHTKW